MESEIKQKENCPNKNRGGGKKTGITILKTKQNKGNMSKWEKKSMK